jgi:iron complex transport system substrate-binding protein
MSSALRIASLLSSATEMLYGLGLGDAVVAVSHECDFPPEAVCKPRATFSRVDSSQASGAIDEQVKQLCAQGESLYDINRQLLRELRPDLIVTQAQCDVCAVRYQDVVNFVAGEPLLCSTQVVALNPMSLDDVLNDIQRIGAAASCDDKASTYIALLRDRLKRIRSRTSLLKPEERPRVAIIEWIEPLMLAANWTPELVDIAGGHCPLTVAGRHSTYSSWSEIVKFDPEVLVVAPCGFDLARTQREAGEIPSWSGFAELAATRAKRVWAVDGNAYFNRSGPRLVESLEILAHLFHPQRVPPPACLNESSVVASLTVD